MLNLSNQEINLIRQWYNAVRDTSPEFLEEEDAKLMAKILKDCDKEIAITRKEYNELLEYKSMYEGLCK